MDTGNAQPIHAAIPLRREPEGLPQCEGHRGYPLAQNSLYLDARCLKKASYAIDGQKLCPRHAGMMALALLLRATEASRGRGIGQES